MLLLLFSGKDLNSLLGSHFVLIQHHQRSPLLPCCLELYEVLVMTSETYKAKTFKRVVREEKKVLKFSWLKHLHSECNQDQWIVFTWRHGGHIGVPKQSSGSLLLFLCKTFLCSSKFAYILATWVKTLYNHIFFNPNVGLAGDQENN